MPNIIDTNMHGRPGITAAYLITDSKVALVETGPKSAVGNVLAALDSSGITHIDHIIVTHIHLDHAGAAGTLLQHFPEATVHVHPIGAPHLADPTKLWASATRIYGAAMDSMWGGIDPVPEDRIAIVEDGDVIDLGGRTLRAIETPGHASHHHAYIDEATGDLFSGDTLGVYMQDPPAMRPTTPPPELDLEAYRRSIEKLGGMGATNLCFTHFGIHRAAPEVFSQAIDELYKWAGWVEAARAKSMELDEVTTMVQEAAAADREGRLSAEEVARLESTTSYRMNVMGYMRYFDGRG